MAANRAAWAALALVPGSWPELRLMLLSRSIFSNSCILFPCAMNSFLPTPPLIVSFRLAKKLCTPSSSLVIPSLSKTLSSRSISSQSSTIMWTDHGVEINGSSSMAGFPCSWLKFSIKPFTASFCSAIVSMYRPICSSGMFRLVPYAAKNFATMAASLWFRSGISFCRNVSALGAIRLAILSASTALLAM